MQVIPFKREEFTLQVGATDDARRVTTSAALGTHLRNGYRQQFWSRRKEQPEEE
jgi:phosphopantothenoylcysteine synthetase/decarboxylase